MTPPSVKWSVTIALALACSGLPPLASWAGPAETAGNNTGNQALGVYGSIEGIRNNAYAPLTSSATPMKSLDGTKTFSGQIQCPSSREFLTVLLTPTMGGETSVTVGEDLDLNGSVEYRYGAPLPASGVCANGLISCNPGSWNNCRGYRWTANPAGKVSLVAVTIDRLAGCYCINASCGANLLMTRTGEILATVGGGVTGAIQAIAPNYTITATRISGTAISYHGLDTAGCSSLVSRVNLPTAYYTNASQLALDGTAEAQAQSSDPTSFYSLLSASHARSGDPALQAGGANGRLESVVTTTSDNGTTMTYQDLRKDDSGAWVTENKSVTLGDRVDYSAPILACKTRTPSRKTDAVSAGNATQYLSNPDTWDVYYKRCDDGVCPVDAAGGERILIDCQVINEFKEAATIVSVLDKAGKDMICSDGTKK